MSSYIINTHISADIAKVADSQKRLSICLETNGFSFSIINLKRQLLSFGDIVCTYPNTLSQMIALIKQIFLDMKVDCVLMDAVELIVPTNKYTWIPEHLFEKSNEREYFNLVCDLAVTDVVCHDFSDKLKAYSVFAIPDILISAFKVAIPGIRIRNQQSKVVSTSLFEKSRMKPILNINVRKKEFDVCVFNNKNVLVCNTFLYSNNSDIVYYALNLIKQLHVNEELLEVHIAGKVDRAMFAYLEQFFRKVVLYTGTKLEYSNVEMYKIPLYKYSLLFD